jgi:hypothetical protein
MPAQVIIIRHAEKPLYGNILSTKGRERAAALVPYFLDTPDILVYGTPSAIYASGPYGDDSSIRSVETVKALAIALKLPLKDCYTHDEYPKMIEEIKKSPEYNGRMVLICWEHQAIPDIARAFGALQIPARWPVDVFDRVWVLSFQHVGKVTFQNIPQRLLFGDSFE